MTRKHQILVVDDVEFNRSLLADMLCVEYEILEAENGLEAVDILDRHAEEISLVLLDIVMPVMDGFEVLSLMKQRGWIDDIPVITISSETASDAIEKAYSLGTTEYINRPFDENIVQRRVKNTLMLYAKQKKLKDEVTEQILEKEYSNSIMVEILSNIVEFRNGDSGRHVLNIRTITELLLYQLSQTTDTYPLSSYEISLIVNASPLHDIGKISIPEEILNKPGKLTPSECEVMKTHCAVGERILGEALQHRHEALIQVASGICRWHHERYDGAGYPDGLKGDLIPIAAQVVALADVYDALTSRRVYKPALSHEQAIEMILGGECGAFNPVLLQCLTAVGADIKQALSVSAADRPSFLEEASWQIYGRLRMAGQVSDRTLALLERERTKWQFYASMAKEILFEYNVQADTLTLSEWGARQLGLSELIAHPEENVELHRVISKEDYIELKGKLHHATQTEPVISQNYLLYVNGSPRWYRAVARPLWCGEEPSEMVGAIGKFTDIHEEYTEFRSFKKMAVEDSLTRLRNHTAARKEIETLLGRCDETQCAMILFDLDNFKMANDQYGHLFGDDVLRYVAQLVSRCIREGDIAARVGGDEFMIFISYRDRVEPIVRRIFDSLTGEYSGFPLSVSMGVAEFPKQGTDYSTLFNCADQALYTAKNRGKRQFCVYDESARASLSVLSPIENDLKPAGK